MMDMTTEQALTNMAEMEAVGLNMYCQYWGDDCPHWPGEDGKRPCQLCINEEPSRPQSLDDVF